MVLRAVDGLLREPEVLQHLGAALDEHLHIGVELARLVPDGRDAARLHGLLYIRAGHRLLRRLEQLLAAVLGDALRGRERTSSGRSSRSRPPWWLGCPGRSAGARGS